MKITKVETNTENLNYTKVHIEHNDVEAYYLLQESFQPAFQEELENFQKTFFDNGETDWRDCDIDPSDFFSSSYFLKSESYEKQMAEQEEEARRLESGVQE